MKKTKVICTIGPASQSVETLSKLVEAGMNVARINFSHGSHEEHLTKINNIKSVREQLHEPIAIMLDTKGPEYSTGCFKNGKVVLNSGDTFTFTTKKVLGDEHIVSVNYKNLVENYLLATQYWFATGFYFLKL